jgi:hypothetical protein
VQSNERKASNLASVVVDRRGGGDGSVASNAVADEDDDGDGGSDATLAASRAHWRITVLALAHNTAAPQCIAKHVRTSHWHAVNSSGISAGAASTPLPT